MLQRIRSSRPSSSNRNLASSREKKMEMTAKPGGQQSTVEIPTRRPTVETACVFDFFVDLPHPAASSKNERAKIIDPPGECHPGVVELFDSKNLSRIAMFAFPDYDAEKDKGV